jgi:succinoglycan biosynthesis protein ExoA
LNQDVRSAIEADPGTSNLILPILSIVIPIFNEAVYIANTLDELLSQDYPVDRFELLICDGMSEDSTREIVGRYVANHSNVQLLDNPQRFSGAGRNIGFRAAKGELCVVIDGHVRIGRLNYFRELARCLKRSGADCLGRPQPLVAEKSNGFAEIVVLARNHRLGHSPDSLIYGDFEGVAPAASIGAAYRPEVFEQIGYVSEDFDACEDLEFNTRLDEAGLRCYTSPSLAISYFARDSLGSLFRQMYRYGYGRFKYLLLYRRLITLAQLIPSMLVLGVTIPFLMALTGVTLLLWIGIGVVTIYLLLIASVSAFLACKSRLSNFGRLLCVFPVIHLGLGVGFLAGLAGGGRIRRRQ